MCPVSLTSPWTIDSSNNFKFKTQTNQPGHYHLFMISGPKDPYRKESNTNQVHKVSYSFTHTVSVKHWERIASYGLFSKFFLLVLIKELNDLSIALHFRILTSNSKPGSLWFSTHFQFLNTWRPKCIFFLKPGHIVP